MEIGQVSCNRTVRGLAPVHKHFEPDFKCDNMERVWRKGNPPTLSVGMQVGAATVESSMEVPQKLKI